MNSILSLFSGGGLLDLGFINNGFQTELAVEIEQPFIYAYNYGVKNYIDKNKSALSKYGIIHKEIEKPINASIPYEQRKIANSFYKITGIIGGPPCQDYSIGGSNQGKSGERGKLIFS